MILLSLFNNRCTKIIMNALWLCFALCITSYAFAQDKQELRFKKDGTFKIVMFSDFQDSLPINQKSLNAMNKILDTEKPDFVMLGGDQVNGGVKNKEDLKKYLDQVVKPMESRKIWWAHVFGNHDEDTGIPAAEQEKIYENYKYCLSQKGEDNVDGVGNYVLPVLSSKGNNVAFNIWGLDSHRYIISNNWYSSNLVTDMILKNSLQGHSLYDLIKFSQIMWYYNKSTAMEKQYGYKIPGLMFFHIPLPEFRAISMNPKDTEMTGEKNEEEFNSSLNSGLFSAILQRGDIKGVFSGHDHGNNYVGTYWGIKLGYDGSIGYAPYGLKSGDKDRLRGARVFEINEKDPTNFKTWIRLATDTK